jgi:hypothetical protein
LIRKRCNLRRRLQSNKMKKKSDCSLAVNFDSSNTNKVQCLYFVIPVIFFNDCCPWSVIVRYRWFCQKLFMSIKQRIKSNAQQEDFFWFFFIIYKVYNYTIVIMVLCVCKWSSVINIEHSQWNVFGTKHRIYYDRIRFRPIKPSSFYLFAYGYLVLFYLLYRHCSC